MTSIRLKNKPNFRCTIKFDISTIEAAHRGRSWSTEPPHIKRRYIQILRSLANARTYILPATRARARQILADRGIPLTAKRETTRRASPPDAMDRARQEARFLGLVRRKKRDLVEELARRPVIQIVDPAAAVAAAVEELVREGSAVVISDETARPTRGRLPDGEVRRRERRVIRLGPNDTSDEERI